MAQMVIAFFSSLAAVLPASLAINLAVWVIGPLAVHIIIPCGLHLLRRSLRSSSCGGRSVSRRARPALASKRCGGSGWYPLELLLVCAHTALLLLCCCKLLETEVTNARERPLDGGQSAVFVVLVIRGLVRFCLAAITVCRNATAHVFGNASEVCIRVNATCSLSLRLGRISCAEHCSLRLRGERWGDHCGRGLGN